MTPDATGPRRHVVIDSTMRWDKQAFLAQCARVFAFPGYFGWNWDALADCLSDVDAGGGLVVTWRGWRRMRAQFPRDFAVADQILAEFADRQRGWGADVTVVRHEEGTEY